MLNVIYTIDVEVWCNGWNNLEAEFADAFERYIYGSTSRGDYGLPFQLKSLMEHGLTSVCFVEPLFAYRFGIKPLQEIISLIKDYKQEIQLHLHTEWVDEAKAPIIPNSLKKRQHLYHYTLAEQIELISSGKTQLLNNGVSEVNAFRAGSFGLNRNTLSALKLNDISIDASYNPTMFGDLSGLSPKNRPLFQPVEIDGVFEYPMTTYYEKPGQLRHVQIGACSFKEITNMLWQALENQWDVFIILSHNFEFFNHRKTGPNPIVLKRFFRLCDFLEKNRDVFQLGGFNHMQSDSWQKQPRALRSSRWLTIKRLIEQVAGRIYR